MKEDYKSMKESYSQLTLNIARMLYLIEQKYDRCYDSYFEITEGKFLRDKDGQGFNESLTDKEVSKVWEQLGEELASDPEDYWTDHEKKRWEYFITDKEHAGDCCYQPATCCKCVAQEYVFRAEELLLKMI